MCSHVALCASKCILSDWILLYVQLNGSTSHFHLQTVFFGHNSPFSKDFIHKEYLLFKPGCTSVFPNEGHFPACFRWFPDLKHLNHHHFSIKVWSRPIHLNQICWAEKHLKHGLWPELGNLDVQVVCDYRGLPTINTRKKVNCIAVIGVQHQMSHLLNGCRWFIWWFPLERECGHKCPKPPAVMSWSIKYKSRLECVQNLNQRCPLVIGCPGAHLNASFEVIETATWTWLSLTWNKLKSEYLCAHICLGMFGSKEGYQRSNCLLLVCLLLLVLFFSWPLYDFIFVFSLKVNVYG